MAIRLAHGAERDLGDLRPAADDDDPLPEHRPEGTDAVNGADVVDGLQRRHELVLSDILDLELDLDERRIAFERSHGRQRADASAEAATAAAMVDVASSSSKTSNRIAAVEAVVRRAIGSRSAGKRAASGRARPEVADGHRFRAQLAHGVVLLEREPQARRLDAWTPRRRL